MALNSCTHTQKSTMILSNDQNYNLVGKPLYMFTLLLCPFFFIGIIQVFLSTVEEGVDSRMRKV